MQEEMRWAILRPANRVIAAAIYEDAFEVEADPSDRRPLQGNDRDISIDGRHMSLNRLASSSEFSG
jgi:hypothetical protein